MKKVKLGISACLLGEKVRYDGGHKKDPLILESFGRHTELVPFCPEAGCGLGVPREPLYLKWSGKNPRVVTVRTGRDMTSLLETGCTGLLNRIERQALWGFIVKSRSPSCGPEVVVQGPRGPSTAKGLFVRMAGERFPLLPVEDDEALHCPEVRRHFLRRLFMLKRWRDLAKRGRNKERLLAFHDRHRLAMGACSEGHGRELDQLVARAHRVRPSRLYGDYERLLLECLSRCTANVADHQIDF